MSDNEFTPQFPHRFLTGDDVPMMQSMNLRFDRESGHLDLTLEVDIPREERFIKVRYALTPEETRSTRVIETLIDGLEQCYRRIEQVVHEQRAAKEGGK